MQQSQQRRNRQLVTATVIAATIAVTTAACSQPAPQHSSKVVAHKKVSSQIYKDHQDDGQDKYYLPTYNPAQQIMLWWTLTQPANSSELNFAASRTATIPGTWARMPSTFSSPPSLTPTGSVVQVNAAFGVPMQTQKADGTLESEATPSDEATGSASVVIDARTTPQEAQKQIADNGDGS